MTLDTICSLISDLFPVIAGLYYYKRLGYVLKIVAVFLFISALSDFLGSTLTLFGIKNNCPVIHIYIIASLVFFGIIYYHAFFNPVIKKIIVVLSAIAFLIMLYNVFFIERIEEYPSVSNSVLSVLLILFSLMYFYQLLTRQEFIHIEKQGLFWINASVLFYYSVTIFLFMLYKKLPLEQMGLYFMINSITNIIANILYSVGLLCKPQRTASYRY